MVGAAEAGFGFRGADRGFVAAPDAFATPLAGALPAFFAGFVFVADLVVRAGFGRLAGSDFRPLFADVRFTPGFRGAAGFFAAFAFGGECLDVVFPADAFLAAGLVFLPACRVTMTFSFDREPFEAVNIAGQKDWRNAGAAFASACCR